MIQIKRSKKVPLVLRDSGARRRDEHIARHAAGDPDFAFDQGVYGNGEVKSALRISQHDKCCFCESKVTHVAFGDVEHFRPKAGYRVAVNDALTRPGYYWLAYEWDNLLFACELCNRRHKGSLFPLLDESMRVRAPADDLGRERPVFIDPGSEDPTQHISFRQEYAFAIAGANRGTYTLQALQLNRAELVERRRNCLEKIRLLTLAALALRRQRNAKAREIVRDIEMQLARSISDEAEFSSAANCAVRLDAVSVQRRGRARSSK